jgi:hypothetical protein
MHPLLSWALFITAVGVAYFATKKSGKKRASKKIEPLHEKPKAIVPKSLSGTDAAEAKKKLQQKKKKPKKAALSNNVAKDVLSTDDGGNQSDGDAAHEVDSADVAKRLQAMKQGLKPSVSRSGGRQTNLAPSAPAYAASQTSSTGGDADIDEEEQAGPDYLSIQKSSSTDPSDMLEAPTGGPGVLRIGAPIQPPRPQKKKITSSSSDTGIHASKNAKKKEKKKAEREAERADQHARFEQHRKAVRAQEATQQQNKPVQAQPPQSSAWSTVNGKKTSTSANTAPIRENFSGELLDTFVPNSQTSSHASSDEKLLQSTTLGDSWEAIPQGAMAPELEWNEVKSKKMRKDRKGDESEATKSADEYKPRIVAVPEPVNVPVNTTIKQVQRKESRKNITSSTTPINASSSDTTKTASSSDWAEVDNIDNWAVHPESSDF